MSSEHRIRNLERMLLAEPADIFLNYALALEYLRDDQGSALAAAQFRKVLELDPRYIPAYYQLGKLLESKDPEKALEQYKAGLALAEEKKDRKTASEFREAIFMLEE
jgi:Tfp pilus assembly protein PilF